MMSVFVLAFISSFVFYLYSQKDVREDWRKKIVLFPLFMAGSMGLAVNNSRAVFEGLLNRKSEFVRTPKFNLETNQDSWIGKKYMDKKLGLSVYVEALLAVYCFIGILSSLYFMEFAALPFQILFFIGFAFMSITSIRHTYGKPGLAKK